MLKDQLRIIYHVLTILEIETEVKNILLAKGINSVQNLLNTKDCKYQYFVDNTQSKFFSTHMDQIFIFQHCH